MCTCAVLGVFSKTSSILFKYKKVTKNHLKSAQVHIQRLHELRGKASMYTHTPSTLPHSRLQPPVISENLREVVNRLAREATCKPAQSPTQTTTVHQPDIYANQITNWTQRLTPAQLSRRYSMEEIMTLAGLKGRYRDHASVRYTGEALRRCGFVTKRDWTTAGRNKRYWIKVEA